MLYFSWWEHRCLLSQCSCFQNLLFCSNTQRQTKAWPLQRCRICFDNYLLGHIAICSVLCNIITLITSEDSPTPSIVTIWSGGALLYSVNISAALLTVGTGNFFKGILILNLIFTVASSIQSPELMKIAYMFAVLQTCSLRPSFSVFKCLHLYSYWEFMYHCLYLWISLHQYLQSYES